MSPINCLRISDSKDDAGEDGMDVVQENKTPNFKLCLRKVDRSWSGNLAPNLKPKPNWHKLRCQSSVGHAEKPKKTPSCLDSVRDGGTGGGGSYASAPPTPRLVRSCGMRRDWSFEDTR